MLDRAFVFDHCVFTTRPVFLFGGGNGNLYYYVIERTWGFLIFYDAKQGENRFNIELHKFRL